MIRFISDLHLDQGRPNTIRAFLLFLEDCQNTQTTALYILGDFFEYWIGDDAIEPWMQPIILNLNQASVHFPIFFMHGNRDFSVGRVFARKSNIKIINDPTKLKLQNKTALLLHGDLLCTEDTQYLRFRKIIRNPFILFILRNLPLKTRLKLAKSLRNSSQEAMTHKTIDIMDASEEGVLNFAKKYQCDIIIHGHTHRPKEHKAIRINQKSVTRFTLGDWGKQAIGLELDESNDTFKLVDFLDN